MKTNTEIDCLENLSMKCDFLFIYSSRIFLCFFPSIWPQLHDTERHFPIYCARNMQHVCSCFTYVHSNPLYLNKASNEGNNYKYYFRFPLFATTSSWIFLCLQNINSYVRVVTLEIRESNTQKGQEGGLCRFYCKEQSIMMQWNNKEYQ